MANETNTLVILRNLSGTETLLKHMNNAGILTIGLVLKFRSKSNSVDYKIFQNAVNYMKSKYEVLQCRIKYDETNGLFFFQRCSTDKVDCQNWGSLSENDFKHRFSDFLHQGISTSEFDLQWKASYAKLEGSRFATNFVFSHAIIDGVGLLSLAVEWFTILEKISKGNCEPVLKSIELSPTFEEMIPNSYRFNIFIRLMSKPFVNIFRYFLRKGRFPFRHDAFNTEMGRPVFFDDTSIKIAPSYHLIKFNSGQVSQIQKFNHASIGTTFSSILIAVKYIAFMRFLHNEKKWPSSGFACQVLRDPRPFFTGAAGDATLVSNYASTGLLYYGRIKNSSKSKLKKTVVKMGRKINREISMRMANHETIKFCRILIQTMNSSFAKEMATAATTCKKSGGRFAMFMFSNIGKVCAPDFEDLSLLELCGMADQSICGDTIGSFLVTVNDVLYWNLCYPLHIFDDHRMSIFADEIENVIQELIANSVSTTKIEMHMNDCTTKS